MQFYRYLINIRDEKSRSFCNRICKNFPLIENKRRAKTEAEGLAPTGQWITPGKSQLQTDMVKRVALKP